MVGRDATIVSFGLPSARAALHTSDAARAWVITAYTLSFCGLLLLGGRFADFFGRKPTFLAGRVGFALASALGRSAPTFSVLAAPRALQAASATLPAPTPLPLPPTPLTAPK